MRALVLVLSAGCGIEGSVSGGGAAARSGLPTETSETLPTETTAPDGGGFMTGGGTFADGVHHGFNLSCGLPAHHENLEVNWGGGAKFHLTSLTSVSCADDPAIEAAPPGASFDTLHAVGVGELDGVPGVTIEITLTDAGEPGRDDTATIRIDGGAALDAAGAVQGNHNAHDGDGDTGA